MNNFEVSVIVPIYNGRRTIDRCINSLIRQTYKKIEIILVDDGSTDGSRVICELFSKKYENIVSICKSNNGVSAARNTGIENAKGKYLMFSDCDDYYEEDAVEKMINASIYGTSDLVIGGVKKYFTNNVEQVCCSTGIYEREQVNKIICQMQENFMLNQMWGKLFRRDIIKDNNIFLCENMSIAEDLEWMCRYMTHVKVISSLEDVVYNYVISTGESLSTRFYINYFQQIDNAYASLVELYKKKNMWEDYKKVLINGQLENYWKGLCAISNRQCSFTDKMEYIRKGSDAKYYWQYLQSKYNELNFVKRCIMKVRSIAVRTLAVELIGAITK